MLINSLSKLKDSHKAVYIFLFALATRFLYFAKFMNKDYFFTKYPTLAQNIIKEGWLGTNVFGDNPLYIYFHAIALTIFAENSLAATLVIQFVTGSISCVLTYFIAKKLFDSRVAIIAALIQAFYGMLIVHEGSYLPATLVIFFNSLAFLYLLKFSEGHRLINLFFASVFLGLSANTRPNILLFVILCFFWIAVQFRKDGFKKLIFYPLFFCLITGLFLLPIGIRNYLAGKDIVPVTASGGVVFYFGNNPEASGLFYAPPREILPVLDSELKGDIKPTDITVEYKAYREMAVSYSKQKLSSSQASEYWFKRSLDFIKSNPMKYLQLELRKLFFALNSFEACDTIDTYLNYMAVSKLPLFNFGVICSLGILGIISSFRYWKRLSLAYLMLITYSLTLLIFFVLAKYRLPIVPFLIIFSAYLIVYGYELVKVKKYKKLIILIISFFILIFVSGYENDIIKDAKKHQLAHHVYFNQAVALFREGDYKRSLEMFDKAKKIHPQLSPRVESFVKEIEQKGIFPR